MTATDTMFKKLVIEVLQSSGSGRKRHFILGEFPARIGRGFHNQVIIDDIYVSPDHLEITFSEADGFFIEELGATNGLILNGEIVSNARVRVYSGDHIVIGKTVLRVYRPHHSVAPTARLAPQSGVLRSLSSLPFTLGLFVLSVASLMTWAWLDQWTDRDETAKVLAGAGFAAAFSILVWAALWGLFGRLNRHRANFLQQAGVASLYLLMSVLIYFVTGYTGFLSNSSWITDAVGYGLNFIVLALFLNACLGLATDLMQKKRMVISTFFALGILTATGLMSYVSAESFDLSPGFPAKLEPYLANFAPAQTLEEYIASSNELFSRPDFQ